MPYGLMGGGGMDGGMGAEPQMGMDPMQGMDPGMGQAPPDMGGYQDQGGMDLGYGGPGAEPAPMPSEATGVMKLLYAKDIAKHGAVQLQELDKAAKFRRALSMIQETFATITGRPDIAAQVRQQIVNEDQQRAAAVESQILARVGRQALAEEDAKKQQAQMQQQARAAQQGLQAATGIYESLSPGPNGEAPPPLPVVADAYKRFSMGDPSMLSQILIAHPPNKARAEIDKEVAKKKALGPVELEQKEKESAIRVKEHGQEVGQSAAAARETHRKNRDYDNANPAPEKPTPKDDKQKPLDYSRIVKTTLDDLDSEKATNRTRVDAIVLADDTLTDAVAKGKLDLDDPAVVHELRRLGARKAQLIEKIETELRDAGITAKSSKTGFPSDIQEKFALLARLKAGS